MKCIGKQFTYYRVTKINGIFIIVTYGEPELRLKFLNNCINMNEMEKVNISVEKVEISMLSNLINALRNRSQDGAISSALKDQTILLNSLIDVYDCKIADKELDQAIRKKFLCMKILALTKLKKFEKQKRLEQLAIDMKKDEETELTEKYDNNKENKSIKKEIE